MSVHARCQQRIASTCAHRTVWRRRQQQQQQQQQRVRSYASATASDPEWFQKVRDDLLGRRPRCHPEELDATHYDRFNTTLQGFAPSTHVHSSPKAHVPLAELLTRFNVHVQSAELLRDGTDPFHCPGEPWIRRMWAGGAVKVRPARELGARAGTVTPFRLRDTVACLERIKHVRLHGTGDEAKVYVTIERCFAPSRDGEGTALPAKDSKRVHPDLDWSTSSVTEERNLVFMKAKTGAELASSSNSQGLAETRYLKAPEDPDYSHSLTPTPSLLFRYSAITYNAHLLHIDPTYAHDVEGHRNILVHGPLTLTLMLQALHTHLKPTSEAITSLEYRNIAPLYCDEAMRICVKRKKQTDTGHSWDVWVEGPTGGMAVKAVAHSAAVSSSTQASSAPPESSQPATPKPHQEPTPFSRTWRSQRIGNALRYLYLHPKSPLVNMALVAREATQEVAQKVTQQTTQEVAQKITPPPAAPLPPTLPPKDQSSHPEPLPFVPLVPFSKTWRKRWIGNALPWLYAHAFTPLVNRNVVRRNPPARARSPESRVTYRPNSSPAFNPEPEPEPNPPPPDSQPHPHPQPGFRLFHIYDDGDSGVISTRAERGVHTQEYIAARRRREKGLAQLSRGEASPAEDQAVFGFLDTGDMQHEREVARMAGQRRDARKEEEEEEEEKEVRVSKVEGFRIREMKGDAGQKDGGGYRKEERRVARERAVAEGRRRREEREGRGGE